MAEKGARRVHSIGNEHGENVTKCANAVGTVVSPMILFNGKKQKKKWADNLPSGSVIMMTDKGSMTQVVFVAWLKHFAKYKSPGTNVLVFDGAKCHLSYDIVDIAEQLNIVLYGLPSNTTHELQPLDKAVFRSFEINRDAELSHYWFNHSDRALTKQRFAEVFTPVWDRSLTPTNIKSGFKATGLYPYDPFDIPATACMPSRVSYRENIPETHSASISQAASTESQPGSSDVHPHDSIRVIFFY